MRRIAEEDPRYTSYSIKVQQMLSARDFSDQESYSSIMWT